jgi:N6-L-threonylcarbamoyladenine synthase
VERILPVVREALAQAGVGLGWIDAIAVGNRPGLIGSLLVGVSAAKALAWSLSKPLVGIDHVHAHLYSGMLLERDSLRDESLQEVVFPALGLVVSGGHTSLYRIESWTRITRLGATIDDAIGEAFDKTATILGLPYPGGPNLDRLAQTEGANASAFELPISRLGDSLDFSFSGLKTAVLYAARGVPGRHSHTAPSVPLDEARKADLAASFQKAAVDAVLLKVVRALNQVPRTSDRRCLLTGGGVTANSRLRRELLECGRGRGVDVYLPAKAFTVDNAAMIAGLAHHFLREGVTADLGLQATPTTAC